MIAAAPAIRLRPETDDDRALSREIYGSARAEELARVPWSQTQREAFLDMQFDAQRRHYRAHYPQAEWSIVVVDGADAGRLYLDDSGDALLLVDVVLLPSFRGRGIGRALLAGVLARADAGGRAIRLHVEKDNPALGWYLRLGFAVDGDAGAYWRMQRPAPASKAAA